MIHVRPSEVTDLDEIVAIEAAPDTAEWVGDKGLAWHRRSLADDDQEHLVVEDAAGEIIGFAVLAGMRGSVVEIRRLALAGARRGGGYGRSLIQLLIRRAYDVHEAERIWLDLRFDNDRARSLYESEGFVSDGTVPDGMNYPDGTPCDLLLMRHVPSA